MAKLNNKQERFCREYIIDLNATRAAIRAEYSEKTSYSIGQRLLKKVECQEYIQELMNKRASKVAITAEDVLKDLIDTRDTLRDVMVQKDDNGFNIIDTSAVNGRIKANELLGKHLQLFVEKKEIEHTGQQITIVNDLGGNYED